MWVDRTGEVVRECDGVCVINKYSVTFYYCVFGLVVCHKPSVLGLLVINGGSCSTASIILHILLKYSHQYNYLASIPNNIQSFRYSLATVILNKKVSWGMSLSCSCEEL